MSIAFSFFFLVKQEICIIFFLYNLYYKIYIYTFRRIGKCSTHTHTHTHTHISPRFHR